MASQNDDDDWDKVEIKLETMKLNEPKSILKPPVSIAPRYNPGNSGNTDLQSSYGSSSPVIIRPGVQCVAENVPEGALDSALISAMTSSRERMVCLQIENSILNFVKSNDKSMDIPTQFNSFRRLLVYRVGQRFGLNHVQTDSVNEYGERGVTLYKTANTFIPKKLLIDLNIPVNQDDDFDGNTGGGSGSNQTEPAPAPQKKFMVMKRNPARSDDGAKVVAVKVQQSAEDKERAYQQARARIFGEENAGGASTPGSQVDSTPASGNVSPALPDNNGNSGKGNKGAGGSNSPLNSARNSNSSSPQPLNSNNNSNNNNSGSSGSSAGIAATNTAAVKRNTSDSALSVQSNGSANGGGGGNNSNNNNNSNKKKETTNISPAGKTSTASTSSSPAPGDSAEKAKNDSNANTASAASASSVGTNAPKKAVVNANNWKENKSQVRNLEAERSDPDFARINNHNSNNNNGYNGGRGNPSADSVGMSSAAATGVLQYTNNTFYPAAPQQQIYYPPMDANQMNHLVAAQQQFLYQQQQHLQLQQQQQQQQGLYGGFPPLNFNSAVPPQGAGLQGPGGMQLAPTLPDNPYHPMSTAAGVSPQQQWQPQYNPYYPMPPPSMQPPQQQLGGAAPQYQQQHQQQFVPPPPPFAPPVQQQQQASPSATFFDYSHLSTKNQQAQQRNKSGNNNNNHNNNNNGNGPSPADYPPLA